MRHPGEFAVQRRAGVRLDGHGSARVRAEIPEAAARFLESQRMVVIGAEDHEGRVWAAPLTGRTGFAAQAGDRTVVLDAVPGAPLAGLFDHEHDIGMLAIEPWTRRRMRVNGRARRDGDRLTIHTEQVYSNCPKYLQKRTIAEHLEPGERTSWSGDRLSAAQREWIGGADTFFVATHAPGLGSDVSHRGGNPGFVEVVDDRRLVWPDYAGNLMYMTLGNLELNPAAGVLFLDWTTGDALHVTGSARVDWDPRDVPGAQRLVEFDVERVLEVGGASPLRWAFEEYSRFNPPVADA
ncbi:pyridoxamine 5'-phosphate oxidase family protein [Microbispora triticiradicis]|uniref:pyridoxamine 5'-phosphate oxidase family protein n=1 Tax=Microbispora triticiradicis TaxID=2200763 RepID=UPI001AD75EAD|nr:pyridoxamine 5'-phosphate oxidase family protein [Microbispora triticiradicis]MBO4270474.1 oxidoreductase [Microbispora triticiradicis]